VTHAQAEVRRAASWVVVIQRGLLVSAGSPEEALSCPEPLGWVNAAGPVNLLRLDAVAGEHAADGKAHVEGQLLTLPPGRATATVPAFVQFAPRDVILTRKDVTGVSARNHLRGRVRRVIAAAQAVFVAVDIGQVFWAEVTPEAAQDLDLHPGAEVVCLLKTQHLQVLE
jgi:molybdopterin-binding protein